MPITPVQLETAYTRSLALLQQMVAIPSTSRDEQAVADLLEQYMQQASGQQVHRHGNNLWLIDPHYDAQRPTLLLNAHIDTVKPVASWQHDPFAPTLETVTLPDGTTEQRLYGLGTNDDGASLVTLLHTYLLLTAPTASQLEPTTQHPAATYPESAAQHPAAQSPESAALCSEAGVPCSEAGVPRRPNLIFLASAEEEVSGKNGIESVLPLLPPIAVALVGEPTGMQPAIAEKGLVVLDGVAHGKSGHAARNEGINALYLALDAIQLLRNYRFEHESPTLGPIKVTVTGIQAGTVHNVVPDTCTFMVDCRTTDAYTNEQVVDQLRQTIGATSGTPADAATAPCITLTPRSTRLQPSGIALSHPLVQRILEHGRQPFGSPTLSDQALMRFPSLKMGPGQSARSHTADEYIRPDEIREAIALYYDILQGLVL